MSAMNPYEPPRGPAAPLAGMNGTCPKCGSLDVKRPGYTWWGGALGPKLLNHTVCNACKFGYNGKTRASNTGPIIIYQAVAIVIAVALLGLFFLLRMRAS